MARLVSSESGGFGEFLRRELAPYPGRGSLVARMVIASTLTMLVLETFHLPGGALGGFFALIFARQTLRATIAHGLVTALFFVLGTTFVIASLAMLLDSPVTHFLWVIATFFLVFFVMGATQNYAYATGFAFTLATAIPLWDRPGDVNAKVAGTLFTLLSVAVGAGVTIGVETVYRIFRPTDQITGGIAERLRLVADVMLAASEGRRPSSQVRAMVLQYADVGIGTLRQQAVRAGERPQVRARITAAISMSDRVVQLCALLLRSPNDPAQLLPNEKGRLLALSRLLRQQSAALQPVTELQQILDVRLPGAELQPGAPGSVRPVAELERTVYLFSSLFQIFAPARTIALPEPHRPGSVFAGFFRPDAFQNRSYQLFALRGCIAATLCYLIYNGVDWPGISTALATCIITALGTIGASRQKQFLRIVGAAIGGFGIALPAQVFLLPHMDSISSFTAFFAAATLLAAWLSTSSPRLSYMGLQIAFAFDLVNLQEPFEQISLSIARDRVVGVLLGLVAMWLIFDQIGGKLAGDSMQELVETNLRALGEFAGTLARARLTHAHRDLEKLRSLQARINDTFTTTNGQADGITFEFGRQRTKHLLDRERMLTMQPPMRSLYTILIALSEASLPGSGIGHTPEAAQALAEYLRRLQTTLVSIAAAYSSRNSAAAAACIQSSLADMEQALEEGRGALLGEHHLLLGLCVSLLSATQGTVEGMAALDETPQPVKVHPAPA